MPAPNPMLAPTAPAVDVPLPPGIPDTPGWRAGFQAFRARDADVSLARQLLAKAKARTLKLDIMGTEIIVSWPLTSQWADIERAAKDLQKATDIEDGLKRGLAFCQAVAVLVHDPTLRRDLARNADGALDLAGLIVDHLGPAQAEARKAVKGFRK